MEKLSSTYQVEKVSFVVNECFVLTSRTSRLSNKLVKCVFIVTHFMVGLVVTPAQGVSAEGVSAGGDED